MSNFILEIFTVEFLSNIKVVEFEFKFEPGDFERNYKDFQWGENESQSIPLNSQAICWYGSRIEQ